MTGNESKVFPVSDIFTSLSLFTLNGHLCDRHLPLPWGLLDRLVDSCLAPASKCPSPCFPGAHWNLVFCELGQEKRQPSPQTWRLARGAEAGHGRHSVPWQPLPRGKDGNHQPPNETVQTNQPTNKQTNAKYKHKWKKPHMLRKA